MHEHSYGEICCYSCGKVINVEERIAELEAENARLRVRLTTHITEQVRQKERAIREAARVQAARVHRVAEVDRTRCVVCGEQAAHENHYIHGSGHGFVRPEHAHKWIVGSSGNVDEHPPEAWCFYEGCSAEMDTRQIMEAINAPAERDAARSAHDALRRDIGAILAAWIVTAGWGENYELYNLITQRLAQQDTTEVGG